jgi:hypothetical protein
VLPSEKLVFVDVSEKDYLGKIPVIFQGGKGQIHVKKIDVPCTVLTARPGLPRSSPSRESMLNSTAQSRPIAWLSTSRSTTAIT